MISYNLHYVIRLFYETDLKIDGYTADVALPYLIELAAVLIQTESDINESNLEKGNPAIKCKINISNSNNHFLL